MVRGDLCGLPFGIVALQLSAAFSQVVANLGHQFIHRLTGVVSRDVRV
jgi:hypothetical protein